MAHDRYGRRLTSRGGSPPSPLIGDEMMRATPITRNCFTENQMRPTPVPMDTRQQRPLRSRTGPQQIGGGPRLPRNRMGSLATAIDNSKTPFRSNSAATLQYVPRSSSPEERRVPPVVTIAEQQFVSGINVEKTKPVKRSSIPGYRARCIDDCDSDDEIQRDYHGPSPLKTNTEISAFIASPQPTMKQTNSLQHSTNITFQKQDSGIDQEMDTLQSPTSPPPPVTGISNYDPETYQKHLDDIKRKAMEWSRLQEGLTLLLPNTDGDT